MHNFRPKKYINVLLKNNFLYITQKCLHFYFHNKKYEEVFMRHNNRTWGKKSNLRKSNNSR